MSTITIVLTEPVEIENLGLAVRLTEREDCYAVECSPLLKNGEIAGNWGVFGGSVGYSASTFETEESAREFYGDVQNLLEHELADKYSGFWAGR